VEVTAFSDISTTFFQDARRYIPENNNVYTELTEFFWTFSIVWYSREHDVSETGSVPVLR
jgi:hypothetical protein